MDSNVTIRAAGQDLGSAVPSEAKQFRLLVTRCCCLSLENVERRLLVAQIPELEESIEGAGDEHVLCTRINLHLRYVAIMALKCLRLLHLCLPQVVKANHTIFVP